MPSSQKYFLLLYHLGCLKISPTPSRGYKHIILKFISIFFGILKIQILFFLQIQNCVFYKYKYYTLVFPGNVYVMSVEYMTTWKHFLSRFLGVSGSCRAGSFSRLPFSPSTQLWLSSQMSTKLYTLKRIKCETYHDDACYLDPSPEISGPGSRGAQQLVWGEDEKSQEVGISDLPSAEPLGRGIWATGSNQTFLLPRNNLDLSAKKEQHMGNVATSSSQLYGSRGLECQGKLSFVLSLCYIDLLAEDKIPS